MIFSPSRMILAEEIHHFLRTNPNDDLLENWLSCCQLFSVPSWARVRERNPCVLNMAVRHSDAENHSQICLVIRTPQKDRTASFHHYFEISIRNSGDNVVDNEGGELYHLGIFPPGNFSCPALEIPQRFGAWSTGKLGQVPDQIWGQSLWIPWWITFSILTYIKIANWRV